MKGDCVMKERRFMKGDYDVRKKVLRCLKTIILVLILCGSLVCLPVYADENSAQENILDDFQETKEPDDGREQELQDKIAEIIGELNVKDKGEEKKIYAVYNYVCQNVEYDWQATNDMSSWDGISLGYGQFAYEALCKDKAVCAGISKATYRLLIDLGIEAYYVTGLSDGIPHAWNIVKLNDTYYYLDATSDLGRTQYSYYLKGVNDFTNYGINTDCVGAKLQVSLNSKYDTVEAQLENKDGFRYNAGTGDITIFSYNGNDENVIVPSEIDGRPVKRIVQYAFQYNDMKTLKLSEGIENVSSLFVGQCNKLEKITLPSTVKIVSAGSDTFVSGIDGFVDSCGNLKSIEVAEDNPYLTVIDDVLYDKELTTIIAYPSACTNEVIRIPEGIKSIKGDSFAHNKYIKKVIFPESVTHIGYWAFDHCSSLEDINITANCKFIGQFAFQGTNITNIIIPAESNCTIMSASFNNTPLESIVVEEGNTMYTVKDGVLYENNCALLYETGSKRENVTLAEGTKLICQGAFSSCKYLKKITIPESVKKIDSDQV